MSAFRAARSYLAYGFSWIPGAYKLEILFRFLSKCLCNAEHYDQAMNGESRATGLVLKTLGPSPVVYDIGSNIGDWSKTALELAQDARLHAFEMIPDFATLTKNKIKPWPNAHVHGFGLSDEAGEITAFQAGGGASITSHDFGTKEKIPVTIKIVRGDDFIQSNELPTPAFIKIDVEGHELKVLKGLSQTISTARPIVQFEYGKHYINERIYLKDIFAFFEPMEYAVFQIFPTKLLRRAYKPSLENFWTTNFLAVPKEKAKAFS